MRETFETTIVEFDEETGVGHITLNRPDSLNALSNQLREDIVAGLKRLEAENENSDGVALRAVIMEGAEGHFCAGADINEFSDEHAGASSDRAHYDFITEFPVPVIAKIRGYCLGGGLETAMACDMRFAHEDARLGLPEVDLGILPGAGGVQYISRLNNPGIAQEIALTGEHISAERANDLDIVNRMYGEDLDDATREFAETIASKPPLSVQAIKDSARAATELGLREGRKYDRKLFETLRGTEDFQKGTRAFAEDDYEPEFKGR
jgi:enoyl-CoA hydratase/carnithine racemase